LYLSKLEIFGFKSFAEKTKIEFDSGVCAIVGPNGSGKSNIVDAIRWVLGEQGDKALRSERRDDVVFSGTKSRKPLSVAEVSLTIQNNKNILPTEYTEVQIARRFYRNGETEYYLNGTKVRLKDVRGLFINTGMGPDAYSVIELKMVDAILSSIKNERRKMFEEAAGIISYKQNRDLTYKKLETVKETLYRVNDIIREKQRNVNALERQVKRNEEAKIVFEELKSLEIFVYDADFRILLEEIEYIKSSEGENISLKNNLGREIAESDAVLDKIREELNNYEILVDELNDKIKTKSNAINALERDNLVIVQKLSSLGENIERLGSENKNHENSISLNTERESELNQKVAVLRNTLIVSENSLNEKRKRVEESTQVMKEKKSEIISLGNKVKDAFKKVNDTKSEYEKNKLKLENNHSQLKKISALNEEYLINIEKFSKEKSSLQTKEANLSSLHKELDKKLDLKIAERDNLSGKISELEKILNEKTLELQKKSTHISYLKNLKETFDDYAEGVKYLIKEKSESGIRTVIECLDVEDKYKIAIETALGEISNYVIVDDSKELNKFIELLDTEEKGKVTFILNDKLAYDSFMFGVMPDSRPDFLNEKGVYGFADSLIKVKNSNYALLMKYILDEYVLVEDINVAYRLSADNYYKFITLDGDIVTDSVIRAGGKTNDENIKLVRESKILRLTEEYSSYESEIAKLNDELGNLKKIFGDIDVDSLEEEYSETEKELTNTNNEIAKLDFKINEINKSVASNESSYNEINSENANINKLINELVIEVNNAENEQSNIDKELSFFTGEFETIEHTYSECVTDFNSFNIEFTKLKNEFRNEEQNHIRTLKSIESQKKLLENNIIQIAGFESEFSSLEVRESKNKTEITALKAEEENFLKEYSRQKSVFDKLKKNQNDTDLAQRDRRRKFDAVSQKLINAQVKMKENEIKSDQAKEYILKKYEVNIPFEPAEETKNIFNELNSQYKNNENELDFYRARKNVDDLSERLKKLGGGFQQIIFEDFKNEKEELQRMIEQRADLLDSEKDIRKTIEKINQEARERFLKTFESIRQNFIHIFKELFQEGDEANLKLVYDVDEENQIIEDPLEAKIEITAKPRGKRPTSIELLSGGEKTLTAIALLFAIYLVKPSPFCILDEVDAPLDPANLGRFNRMIRKFSSNTQFILITHNERTMESVDRLYGVTMQEPGVTTIVETKFKNANQN